MSIRPRPQRTSIVLPPYRAVLAVDTQKYTRHSGYHQQILSRTVQSVLEDACRRAELGELWENRRFPQSTGDGYVFGAEPEKMPFLVHPFLHHLQEALEDVQPDLAAHDRELRLRLRVSVHVGPLPDSRGEDPFDGIGPAMNDTHRLLDSDPVRTELAGSDPEITMLVAIVSRRVYEDAVLSRFVGLNPRRFRPVRATVPEKEYDAEGYLYVPSPSLRPDLAEAEQGGVPGARGNGLSSPERESGGAHTVNQLNGENHGQLIQGGTVHGGVHGTFGKAGA
ncbi:hypothetical protein ACQEU5_14260 [Marinactinospora thermotolerans]|uniref:Guanylate cyclase domain-containing protein n=1 Tax=Marinactinospora thermotolerans DSM 45154 TaxID=1122192 RepID=A0A1T4RTA3_9ACTN|nr:hypothetical protein [Marinactinospora thermotolerans]SKA19199.1 hypothetical protein SAMN02745673_02964 [Marinactinospora thermotolerans DSM 45154]